MFSFFALLAFVVLMVGTPGPANLVVMIVGARYGVRRSFGFIAGLIAGKAFLNLFIGFGLGLVLGKAALWYKIFSFLSAVYMIFLAIKSWPKESVEILSLVQTKPKFGFLSGLAVHPLNPKAWVMSVVAWTEFAPAIGHFWIQLTVVVLTFAVCQVILHSLWCWAGAISARIFNASQQMLKGSIIATVGIVLLVTVTNNSRLNN